MLTLQIDERALRTIIADAVATAQSARTESPRAAEYLSVQEAAELLKCSEGTIRNWIDSGELPAYQWGRIVRLKRHELESKLAPKAPTVRGVALVTANAPASC